MKSVFWSLLLLLLGLGCTENKSIDIDIQGHRGCRGLMPENTMPAFLHAIELGVHTLEMDVVVNGDGEVVVSHEPFYNPEFTTQSLESKGLDITKENTNLFLMSRTQMNTFDVGIKSNPRFPQQKSLPALKPTLQEVLLACKDKNVLFNIEIKRIPEYDGIFHPPVEEFVDKVVSTISEQGLLDRTTIQSFDLETLKILKRKYDQIKLALLCEDFWITFDEKVAKLGFVPDIYSPHYRKVSIPLIRNCQKKDVKVIPWTVNSSHLMRKLIYWGVDGIITDYPDRLIETVNNLQN